jgi:guanine deaminase
MHNGFMQRAIELSIQNVRTGKGGPFAAMVVRGGDIVGTGVNRVTSANDPTAHAEVIAIREACQRLATFQLSGCDLYTTCEPCPMCLGAIYWARLDSIFYGNTRDDAARIGFDDALIYGQVCGPLEHRKIPMRPLMREQALEAFREWERSGSKVPY